jgi:alpha-galactosidase
MSTALSSLRGRVRLPGLAPDRVYTVRPLPPGDRPAGPHHMELPEWMTERDVALTGRVLGEVGIQAPA